MCNAVGPVRPKILILLLPLTDRAEIRGPAALCHGLDRGTVHVATLAFPSINVETHAFVPVGLGLYNFFRIILLWESVVQSPLQRVRK